MPEFTFNQIAILIVGSGSRSNRLAKQKRSQLDNLSCCGCQGVISNAVTGGGMAVLWSRWPDGFSGAAIMTFPHPKDKLLGFGDAKLMRLPSDISWTEGIDGYLSLFL